MNASELLGRYLRQRRELGEAELIFEGVPLDGWAPSEYAVPSVRTVERERPAAPARAASPLPPSASPPPRLLQQAPIPSESVAPALPAPLSGALGELKVLADACAACGLSQSRKKVVFGEGNTEADLIVVGEAPGADEDASGRPFVGAAGKLLDLLLASVGFPRETVYICNVLKCRPPANRNPTPVEVDACSHLLRGQISSIRPKAILACGTFAAQTLLGSADPLRTLRSMQHMYQGVPLIATYHPAALLRNPSWVRSVWMDLQRLRQILDA